MDWSHLRFQIALQVEAIATAAVATGVMMGSAETVVITDATTVATIINFSARTKGFDFLALTFLIG